MKGLEIGSARLVYKILSSREQNSNLLAGRQDNQNLHPQVCDHASALFVACRVSPTEGSSQWTWCADAKHDSKLEDVGDTW